MHRAANYPPQPYKDDGSFNPISAACEARLQVDLPVLRGMLDPNVSKGVVAARFGWSPTHNGMCIRIKLSLDAWSYHRTVALSNSYTTLDGHTIPVLYDPPDEIALKEFI